MDAQLKRSLVLLRRCSFNESCFSFDGVFFLSAVIDLEREVILRVVIEGRFKRLPLFRFNDY